MRQHLRRPPWRLWPVLLSLLIGPILTVKAADGPAFSWSRPSSTTFKLLGAAFSADTPYTFPSLDCSQMTFRPVGLLAGDMQTGCFESSSFGLFGVDSQAIIFAGSDEAVPLRPYSAHEILLPWPDTADVLALDNLPYDGQMLSLYRDIVEHVQDQRNALGQLVAKQITAPPDTIVRDSQGKALVINSQTLAFSPGNSWLAVETLGGYFVRVNLATLQITPFAPALNSLGGPSLIKSEVAVSSDGRYVAIANSYYGTFKVYDLEDCSANICASHDYWPAVANQYNGLQTIAHPRFINDGLLSFNVAGGPGSQAQTYELAPADHISSLIEYLALGDSYTSGEGAFDYLTGTDTTENSCHLSRRSYPLLLTNDLFSATSGHSVACSGATINDIGSTGDGYVGQMAAGQSFSSLKQKLPDFLLNAQASFLPGYIAQQRFVSQYQPAIMTVSIGGNDIGFGDILERCVMSHLSRHESDQTCYNTYEDRQEIIKLIDKTKPRLTRLFQQLVRQSPASRLYVVGYPQIVVDNGDCGLNVHLNKSELEFAVELVNYLDSSLQQAASSANVAYIDISQALAGHRLCEAKSYATAVNGLTAGKDAGIFGVNVLGKESYHPNALGQALIEQAILRQTHGFHVTPVSSPTDDGQPLLNVPKTGRTVKNLVLGQKITARGLARGQSVSLALNGGSVSLAGNRVYLIRIDGSDGPVVTSLATDNSGNLSGQLTIPADTAPGEHSLDITGYDQTDEATDISQPIYIISSLSDSDGDGISDSQDSCPMFSNSGQDADNDGIDDACDGFIGTPSQTAASTAQATLVSLSASISTSPGTAQDPIPELSNHSESRSVQATSNSRASNSFSEVNGAVLRIRTTANKIVTRFANKHWLDWLLMAGVLMLAGYLIYKLLYST